MTSDATDRPTARRVVTRFAPSPTGFLHIGGARTALFNWLYARGRDGTFLLRIEDTDRERSTPEATQAIIDGLRWLGLDWDGEPISQFERAERHRECALKLLEAGAAYRCWSSKEEIDAAREQAKAEGRPPLFQSPWRDRDDGDLSQPHVIRLKSPREGEVSVDDAVQGRVTWKASQMDDLILLRSDGTPVYMLAVVVDDHDMGVTHVIRGDDHLTNAARQSLIYKGLGWDVPVFAHISLIHGPDGAKLSKRHGALGIEAYRDMGYLPEALRNYLARLGWAHGDDEFFTSEQAIAWFDLPQINKAAARIDFAKMEHINGLHIRAASDSRLAQAADELLAAQHKPRPSPEKAAAFLEAMPGLKERAKTINELIDLAYYIFADRPLEFDEKAEKLLSDDARAMLARLTSHLRNNTSWSSDALQDVARNFAETEGLKLGKVAQPLRAALTGRAVSPSVFDVMETLGRDECLARLDDAATGF
ncbi:glutamate--tRNA ligase [Albimonas sp. CAU 1670]|uniref:glutamate--tRNA ligase n=1 Tax=Albimonas sp. CAU 1670 TaxID=3032599 RepID=UPI0023DCE073|nr:glutamate--tRNA ligase [Albimonas sp. CAU 1670]MDF2231643.1 glutamate--tRNA ligase [Albimonas sp. CAU 1670]